MLFPFKKARIVFQPSREKRKKTRDTTTGFSKLQGSFWSLPRAQCFGAPGLPEPSSPLLCRTKPTSILQVRGLVKMWEKSQGVAKASGIIYIHIYALHNGYCIYIYMYIYIYMSGFLQRAYRYCTTRVPSQTNDPKWVHSPIYNPTPMVAFGFPYNNKEQNQNNVWFPFGFPNQSPKTTRHKTATPHGCSLQTPNNHATQWIPNMGIPSNNPKKNPRHTMGRPPKPRHATLPTPATRSCSLRSPARCTWASVGTKGPLVSVGVNRDVGALS